MGSGLIIGVAWTAGAVALFRPVFRAILGPLENEWDAVIPSVALAFLLSACFWPLAALGLLMHRVTAHHDPAVFARRLGGESAAQKLSRLERERREREQRIETLERELEIGT